MWQFKKKSVSFFGVSVAILSFTAYSKKKQPHKLAANRDVAYEPPVAISVLPEPNVFLQVTRYKPFADYLSKSISMDVLTMLLDSYDAIYREMLDNIDAALFGSFSYFSKIFSPQSSPYSRMMLI